MIKDQSQKREWTPKIGEKCGFVDYRGNIFTIVWQRDQEQIEALENKRIFPIGLSLEEVENIRNETLGVKREHPEYLRGRREAFEEAAEIAENSKGESGKRLDTFKEGHKEGTYKICSDLSQKFKELSKKEGI